MSSIPTEGKNSNSEGDWRRSWGGSRGHLCWWGLGCYKSQPEAAGDADPAQFVHEPDATEEADDVVHEVKLEKELREAGEADG
jgi:hypothetical protein